MLYNVTVAFIQSIVLPLLCNSISMVYTIVH